MTWIEYAAIAIAIWNFAVFCLYGFDKRAARHGGRRVSEKALLLAAALMGGAGALVGMLAFRHKTRHAAFTIGVPLLLAVNVAVAAYVIPPNYPVPYTKITPEAAKMMMDSDSSVILDVRTESEYEEAHIENAILIPDTDIEGLAPALLPDKRQAILVYCRTGIRSERAARALIGLGYADVYDFGGIVDWPYEVVSGYGDI